ncbi:MAG: hypothetical protein FVQ77_10290 [Cytophagales bacterium]|nr:hypothetical protein [Cytophagales bacterium]
MKNRNKYIELNGKYLHDAKTLLDKQDYVQASEKLWGATSQIIKAVAFKRGKNLRSHAAINQYIVKLSEELNDKPILNHFSIANSLHQNFYENWLAPETVIENAKSIEKLVKKLKPLAV